ncbi:hypothetical protein HHK36_022217 [Tetracentron sinense]|uniref:Uncharacterized protein n=1 Tax=Tetracentron sinense TaxID=13715 RepID=A0A835D8L6_TETSI|nr:hypothetical protein HHK36_022217 [Tetracentron sinense]
MDECKWSHIPAFGNWDYANHLPITQYFESARQARLLCCNSSGEGDLYMAGDLYAHHMKTSPSTVVVPLGKTKVSGRRYPHAKEQKKQVIGSDVIESPRHQASPPRAPKAVDQDLYEIPPLLLHTKLKRVEENVTIGFLFKMFGTHLRCVKLEKKLITSYSIPYV